MDNQTRIDRVTRFIETLNQARELGLSVTDAGDGTLTLCLPYSDRIIGNPDTGVIHGGAITTLMDTTSGCVILCALEDFELCPTLDLRVDYMRPAHPHKPVYARA
ncbi:PaaI family thioesterase, partial [Marinobacter sp.]